MKQRRQAASEKPDHRFNARRPTTRGARRWNCAVAPMLVLLSLCLAWPTTVLASSIAVGGFDVARGGAESITTDAPLQSAISAAFPGATFSGTSTLTPGYLASINGLIIGVGTGNTTATAPLSSAEQAALVNFVKGGGNALLFTDNDTFAASAPTVNNSFVSPFGLATTGTLGGFQATTIVNGSNPVVSGPFGVATGFTNDFPGWFSSIGTAQELMMLNANGQPVLAVLMPGALGAGSGAVIFFGDSTWLDLFQGDTNDTILTLNSLALHGTGTTPEPSSIALFGSGILGLAEILRRRINL